MLYLILFALAFICVLALFEGASIHKTAEEQKRDDEEQAEAIRKGNRRT